jgi:prepilin-type processing-associated H-X9-DG protein
MATSPDRPRTSVPAIISLILGILSFCVPVLLSIPALILGIVGLVAINKSNGRLRGQGLAIAGIILGALVTIAAPIVFLFALPKMRDAADRITSRTRMQTIGLAFQLYHSDNGRFPPAVLRGPTGIPYSWRVELLRELEAAEQALYQQYNKNEPWDSSGNRAVLARMPDVYRMPGGDSKSTDTYYQLVVGPETMFPPGKARNIAEVGSTTAHTLLVVEAAKSVPWTKPEDLTYSSNQPLPALGVPWRPQVHVLFADGSVREASKSTPDVIWRMMMIVNPNKTIPPDAP